MRKHNCINISRFIFFILNLTFLTNANAQYTTTSSASNKVRQIKQELDAPVEVTYEDGRVAQVVRRESVDQFRVPIKLTENSCQGVVGIKCQLIIPFVRQQYAAVWKHHPTRQGQALEYSFNKDVTYGQQLAITRSQNELYETLLKRVDVDGKERDKAQQALSNKFLGTIECEKDLTSALPSQRDILFWDENYENGNSELSMIEGPHFGARVNLIYRRFQNMSYVSQGNSIHLNRFKKSFGTAGDSYPIGLSYMVQMFFRSPNLEDPTDEICKLKWDINFSVYFTQISALAIYGDSKPFTPAGFKPFKYSYENPNPHAQGIFRKEQWEQEGMH